MSKHLVDLIKKIAQGVPDFYEGTAPAKPAAPPAPAAPVAAGPPVLTPTPSSGGGGGIPIVKTMQQGLINLAQDVLAQINLQDIASPGAAAGEASGRNSFADFITKNYLRNSDVPGVEFDPDANKTNMSEKQPTDPSRMNVVMDTMRRIGNPKTGEFAVDGKWGPRTNAALHNAYAYAYALLKLAADFHLHTSYTEENLNALKNDIPPEFNDFSVTQKVAAAANIVKQISGIRRLFNEIKQGVLEKPAYLDYIEGDQVFHTYKHEGLDPQAISGLQNMFGNSPQNSKLRVTFNENGKQQEQVITVNDLLNPSVFQKWMEEHAPHASPQEILTSLKQNIGLMEGSVSLSAPPSTYSPQHGKKAV
jgi:hypothetical protein